MLRANPPEVTTIRGDEGAKFQTFRNGHNGSIDEPEKLARAKKLGRALQVSQRQVLQAISPAARESANRVSTGGPSRFRMR